MKQSTRRDGAQSRDGEQRRRLVIGISGATGAIYGVRLLQVLKSAPDIESHLVMSKAAERTVAYETEFSIAGRSGRVDLPVSVPDRVEDHEPVGTARLRFALRPAASARDLVRR